MDNLKSPANAEAAPAAKAKVLKLKQPATPLGTRLRVGRCLQDHGLPRVPVPPAIDAASPGSENVAHHGDWRAAEVTQAINSEERTRMRPRTLRDHLAPFPRADNWGKEKAENPYR